jgi:hypothetical protein
MPIVSLLNSVNIEKVQVRLTIGYIGLIPAVAIAYTCYNIRKHALSDAINAEYIGY